MRVLADHVFPARRCARGVAVIVALFTGGLSATAQGPAAGPDPDAITVSGSLRSRLESSDWFGDDRNGAYSFAGSLLRLALAQSRPRADWQVELAIPILVGLPDHASAPGAQGALGLGATYFAANDGRDNVSSIFAKQAFLRVRRLGGVEGQSLKIGRMEFVDGAEVVPRDATLATLKRDRIAHRLLGTFGFSHVGRSLDGAQYGLDRRGVNVTALAARPTQGVFQVEGWGELNVTVMYGAMTGQTSGRAQMGEWRLFGLRYADDRKGAVKTDNRPLDVRRLETDPIATGTFGGHSLHAAKTAAGTIDLLAWGAFQNGSWGVLDHRAGAFSTEAGWQPSVWPAMRPWFRGGVGYGSGDSDPADTVHGTFFQILPTPRVYARFPFFNMMNLRDAFGEVRLRSSRALTLRGDIHALRLVRTRDLWYQGGGAFQPSTFGYAGRPSNGHSDLATLYDVSGDIAVNPQVSIGAYGSYASGKMVTQSIYDGARGALFGYVELLLRF